MSSIADTVERLQNGPDSVVSSEFYRKYLKLSIDYETLLKSGLTKKKDGILSNRMEQFGSEPVVFNHT